MRAIFLAEQRHRACLYGIIGRHQAGRHGIVAAYLRVHVNLDLRDLVGGQRLGVGEVETQAVGRDQAALLRHMTAKALAQGGVEQMRGAMIGAHAVAALDINGKMDGVAHGDLPRLDRRVMRMKAAERLGRVSDLSGQTFG